MVKALTTVCFIFFLTVVDRSCDKNKQAQTESRADVAETVKVRTQSGTQIIEMLVVGQ